MSALNTPDLSVTARTSPALSDLRTPDEQMPDFNLDGPALRGGKKNLPDCWAHRGASGAYPENTMASIIEACKLGIDGVETDLHITADNQVLLFHDPELERMTDGHGKIREQMWHGGLEHVRTKLSPVQPIPLLSELLDIMLSPGFEHLKVNLDCKVENDAERMYVSVRELLERVPQWEEKLAPRIYLSLWHPKFLLPAKTILPSLTRYALSMCVADARRYFWHSVQGFSLYYEDLATADGQRFLLECKNAGKEVCAWTVNTKEGMKDCVRWGLTSCITDHVDKWQEVRAECMADYDRALKPTLKSFLLPWITKQAWQFDIDREANEWMAHLEAEGGRFEEWEDVRIG